MDNNEGLDWLNWLKNEVLDDENVPITSFIYYYTSKGYLTIKQFKWLWESLPEEFRVKKNLVVSTKYYEKGEDDRLDNIVKIIKENYVLHEEKTLEIKHSNSNS